MVSKEELLLEEITKLSSDAENADDIIALTPILSKYAEKVFTDQLLLAGAQKAFREYNDCFKELKKVVKKGVPILEKVRKKILEYIKLCNASGRNTIAYNTDSLKYPTKNNELSVTLMQAAIYHFLEFLHKNHGTEHKIFLEQLAIVDSTGVLKMTFFTQADKLAAKRDDRNMRGPSKPGFWFNVLREFGVIANSGMYDTEHKKLTRSNEHARASVLEVRHEALKNAVVPGRDNALYKDNFDSQFYKKAVTETAPYLKRYIISAVPQPKDKAFSTNEKSISSSIATTQSQTNSLEAKNLDWFYDKNTRTFSCNGKNIKFRTFKYLDDDKGPKQDFCERYESLDFY